MDNRTFTTELGEHVVNPIVKAAVERGIAPPSYAILETTGRESRHYVRKIEADARVRGRPSPAPAPDRPPLQRRRGVRDGHRPPHHRVDLAPAGAP